MIGSASQIWTDGFQDLQSRALDHSATAPYFGLAYRNRTHIRRVEAYCIIHYTKASKLCISPGTRTPTNGFGDRDAAITLETYEFGSHGQFWNVDLSLIKRLLCLWVTRLCWRKTEESNPIRVNGTWFSRPVAGPTPLHHLPVLGVGLPPTPTSF